MAPRAPSRRNGQHAADVGAAHGRMRYSAVVLGLDSTRLYQPPAGNAPTPYQLPRSARLLLLASGAARAGAARRWRPGEWMRLIVGADRNERLWACHLRFASRCRDVSRKS
eukprot:5364587-Prymnesium_polylepis.2